MHLIVSCLTKTGDEMDNHPAEYDEVVFCDDMTMHHDHWHDEEDDYYPEEETPWWELYFR